jgi:hypothetical protein
VACRPSGTRLSLWRLNLYGSPDLTPLIRRIARFPSPSPGAARGEAVRRGRILTRWASPLGTGLSGNPKWLIQMPNSVIQIIQNPRLPRRSQRFRCLRPAKRLIPAWRQSDIEWSRAVGTYCANRRMMTCIHGRAENCSRRSHGQRRAGRSGGYDPRVASCGRNSGSLAKTGKKCRRGLRLPRLADCVAAP